MPNQSQNQTHILVVDDDAEIRSLLARYLAGQGFRVSTAADRRECMARLADAKPDLIVLDVLLPDGSGLEICRAMQDSQPRVPVILLTALKEEIDRIVGLEIGADDYLGKPFNPRELSARIRAVLRRAAGPANPGPATGARRFDFGGFHAMPEQRRIARSDGSEIDLTGAEFDLLMVFLERPGRVLSRELLLDLTQGRNRDPLDRSIDVLMSRLRRKLATSDGSAVFKTVRNGGYQLVMPVNTQLNGGGEV
ncbi:response regulator transcription factor [Paracoccus aurantiacus]|uniref:Response regulator transcription factor n=1 Tax=Paracoccus aurantiacus TaxID=2599412 RepID=A0A5C6S2B8_9RHOB|nr:response regulator transcription factor [Paracoccus aurantiacus]TXB68595.1 response regulator transcription factor [Paracoccus aurantiacus]